MYADDTCVFHADANLNKNLNKMNTELGNISIWMKAKCLTLSAQKKPIHDISENTRERKAPCSVFVDGIPIEQFKTIKYLGVHLDENLKLHFHVDHVNRRVSRVIPVIYNVVII